MKFYLKKYVIAILDVAIAAYLIIAVSAFNKPDDSSQVCMKVSINITDQPANGFINANEIRNRLEASDLYPLSKPMRYVDGRKIEEKLKKSPFVKTAECIKTQNDHVYISITQLMPVIRVKASNGDDYYMDDKDCIMPNSHYTSDLIIATGNISRTYATSYISPLGRTIMENKLWSNMIEQINVLPDQGIEFIPRIGNHIVYIGQLPKNKNKEARNKAIEEFVATKMDRLEKFYKYGLSNAGWNRYSYINLEFDNQIICTKSKKQKGVETV